MFFKHTSYKLDIVGGFLRDRKSVIVIRQLSTATDSLSSQLCGKEVRLGKERGSLLVGLQFSQMPSLPHFGEVLPQGFPITNG